jgi:hypothetical protein
MRATAAQSIATQRDSLSATTWTCADPTQQKLPDQNESSCRLPLRKESRSRISERRLKSDKPRSIRFGKRQQVNVRERCDAFKESLGETVAECGVQQLAGNRPAKPAIAEPAIRALQAFADGIVPGVALTEGDFDSIVTWFDAYPH